MTGYDILKQMTTNIVRIKTPIFLQELKRKIIISTEIFNRGIFLQISTEIQGTPF